MGFAPLDFLNGTVSELGGISFTDTIKDYYNKTITNLFTDFGANMKDISEDEYVNFIKSFEFCDPRYKGPLKKFNDLLFEPNVINNLMALDYDDLKAGRVSLRAEWLDVLYMPMLLNKWQKNKQVYKVDEDFAKALIHTDGVILNQYHLTHLPCNCFYVDTSTSKDLYPLMGSWVDVKCRGNYFNIYFVMLRNDNVVFSWELQGEFDETGVISRECVPRTEKTEYYMAPLSRHKDNSVEIDRDALATLCLQLITYMYVKQPDIVETTKATYRPSATIKNKYSEVQAREVGSKYGIKFRKLQRDIKRAARSGGHHTEVHRKSPIPHYRSAHWQTYHVGKGRTEIEQRWIEPIFVGDK